MGRALLAHYHPLAPTQRGRCLQCKSPAAAAQRRVPLAARLAPRAGAARGAVAGEHGRAAEAGCEVCGGVQCGGESAGGGQAKGFLGAGSGD